MKRKAAGPPCDTCEPTIRSGNVEAYGIYNKCSGQLIMAGMSGTAIDIDVQAVKCIMELEEVQEQARCMDKVQMLARMYLSEKAKRRKQDEDAGSPS